MNRKSSKGRNTAEGSAAKKAAAEVTAAARTASGVTAAESEQMDTFRADLENYLNNRYHTDFDHARAEDLYKATASIINQRLL